MINNNIKDFHNNKDDHNDTQKHENKQFLNKTALNDFLLKQERKDFVWFYNGLLCDGNYSTRLEL